MDYTLVIPAYNEEELLPATLASARVAMQAQELEGEIIVVDNASTDDTARLAEQAGARVVHEPHRQISRARNAGGRAAKSRHLIFLDADTTLEPGHLGQALELLESGEVVGGGCLLQLGEVPISEQKGFGAWVSRRWNAMSVRLGLAAGSFVYCRKDAFDGTGGFSEKVYAGEEIWFSRQLKRWGRRDGRSMRFVVLEDPPIVSSDRKLEWHSGLGIVVRLTLIVAFPFLTRWRWACGLWYAR